LRLHLAAITSDPNFQGSLDLKRFSAPELAPEAAVFGLLNHPDQFPVRSRRRSFPDPRRIAGASSPPVAANPWIYFAFYSPVSNPPHAVESIAAGRRNA
jgi:hypothetical protein